MNPNAGTTRRRRPDPRVFQIEHALVRACEQEVRRTYPLESGGVLMGRRLGAGTWCVDHVIGPGPHAQHGRFRFSPDLEYQHEQIALRYRTTDGESTYLGDWHSHPGARHGGLSYLDRKALRRIMDAPSAQCSEPLMVILWGGPDAWRLSAWHAVEASVGLLSRVPRVLPCAVHPR